MQFLRKKITVTKINGLLLSAFALILTAEVSARPTQANTSGQPISLEQSRELYLTARKALQRQQMPAYKSQRQRLNDYPLAPYLDYFELKKRLNQLPFDDISQFLQENQNSYLGDKLRREWLSILAKRELWQDYLRYYHTEINSTALSCFSLQARHATGDLSAMAEVEPLWNVGHSQPKDCDPLFNTWIRAGQLTSDIAWERFKKAMDEGNRTLANYLIRHTDGRHKALAELYVEIGRYPHRIRRLERFQEQSMDMQEIILYGIQRYARQNAEAALKLWERYDAQQLFNESERGETLEQLAASLLRQKDYQAVNNLIADIPQISNESLTEVLIRDALSQQDWVKVYEYIGKLPSDSQQSERWLYWRAKAMENSGIVDPVYSSANEIYTQLASKRDYYAFLAADTLGRDYHLGDSPTQVSQESLQLISSNPAALRARELHTLGDTIYANREWFYMSQRFESGAEHIAAASLASQWGWHQKTIHSLANAKSWDDLQLRFPLAYNKQVLAAAQKNQISPLLLFAITRQESAFAVNARSPAGALGLMQLMPGTARQTAHKAGIDYKKSQELLIAEKNISLGSLYITELLAKYNGNRILAAAAYNAGPNRVDRWLKNSAQQLPIDVWIETIPYKETRKYVQNILAYSVIYGYRTGTTPNLLTSNEAKITL